MGYTDKINPVGWGVGKGARTSEGGQRGLIHAVFVAGFAPVVFGLGERALVDVLQGVGMLDGELGERHGGQRALLGEQPGLEVRVVFQLPVGVFQAGFVHLLHGLQEGGAEEKGAQTRSLETARDRWEGGGDACPGSEPLQLPVSHTETKRGYKKVKEIPHLTKDNEAGV